jgi:hypothetical protein
MAHNAVRPVSKEESGGTYSMQRYVATGARQSISDLHKHGLNTVRLALYIWVHSYAPLLALEMMWAAPGGTPNPTRWRCLRHDTEGEIFGIVIEIGVDPSKHMRLAEALPGIIEETGPDSLSREEKRDIMQALELKVLMYPATSEFARTHEHRWDVTLMDAELRSRVPD